SRQITIETGRQERIPVRFELPATLSVGRYEITATFTFSSGEIQRDTFAIDILPRPTPPENTASIALFDPKGETSQLLNQVGIRAQPVEAVADLSSYDTLIVGKSALTMGGAVPDIRRIRDGLKVILFEQTAEVLEKRLGFRVEEYGARQVFTRVPDHP